MRYAICDGGSGHRHSTIRLFGIAPRPPLSRANTWPYKGWYKQTDVTYRLYVKICEFRYILIHTDYMH
ncbi:hypothetical protein X975_22925, partial [Stegodyphus mimosarum]